MLYDEVGESRFELPEEAGTKHRQLLESRDFVLRDAESRLLVVKVKDLKNISSLKLDKKDPSYVKPLSEVSERDFRRGILALVSLSQRLVHARANEDRMFLGLCAGAGLNAIFGNGFFLAKAAEVPASRVIMLINMTLGRIVMLMLLYFWILYVDYKLNQSRDHLFRKYPLFVVPVGIAFILFIINLFTGILFTIDDALQVHFTKLYYVIPLFNLAYFVISCTVFYNYRKRNEKVESFTVFPFLIPVAAGVVGEFFYFYTVETVGIAVGLLFLYFSMVAYWRFQDNDPFFQNCTYLKHLCSCIKDGTSPVKSVAIFSGKNEEALVMILKEELPKDNLTIRLGGKRFLFCANTSGRNYLRGLSELIRESAEDFDKTHPDMPIAFEVEYRVLPKDDAGKEQWLNDIIL